MAQEIYHRSEWGNPNEQWGNVYLNADLTNELYKRASEYENSWVTDQLLNGVGTKPSIILTPTAYEDGKLNSVKPAKTLGSELVTNGDFSNGTTNWTGTRGATLTSAYNVLTVSSNATVYGGAARQVIPTEIGKKYKWDFTINEANDTRVAIFNGTADFASGTSIIQINDLLTGSYSYTFTAISSSVSILLGTMTLSGQEKYSNVSVKEVTEADFDFTRGSSATRVNEKGLIEDVQILSGNLVQNGDFSEEGEELIVNGGFDSDSNWTKGTGWSIANGKASSDGSQTSNSNLTTAAGLSGIQNKQIKFSFDITNYQSGSITVTITGTGGNEFNNLNSDGTYTVYVSSSDPLPKPIFKANADFIGSIDNVSVKEVGQNWTFGTDWSMGDDKVVRTGTTSSGLTQSGSFNNGKKYKLQFTISDYVGGSIKGEFSGGGGSDVFFTSNNIGNGTFSFITETTTNRNTLQFYAFNSFSGSIDNISVIEITDDTDLPRINYTNFDYQDVLGDELVTNGSFDTDSDWTKPSGWSIEDGVANSNAGAYRTLAQNMPIILGKKYEVVYDVVSYISGSVSMTLGADSGILRNAVGTYSEVIEYVNFYPSAGPRTGPSGFIGSIDNVSVKEITEDVLVPYSGEGSLKLEPSRTNLIQYSEDLTSWTKVVSSVSYLDDLINPSGKTFTSKITQTSSGGYVQISRTFTGIETFSAFVKKSSSDFVRFYAAGQSVYFDILNGTVETISGSVEDKSITYFGNGWFKISITVNSTSSSSVRIYPASSGSSTSGLNSLFVYGAQLEESSYATSYIPTQGSAVTRLADVCNNAGSSDLINSTEGVLYAEISALANDGTNRQISINNNGTSNRVYLEYSSVNNRIRGVVENSGGNQAILSAIVNDVKNYTKVAIKYKQNDFSLFINGFEVDTELNGGVLVGLSELSFDRGDGLSVFYGNVKCVAVFKEALSDTELQKLTQV